MDVYEDFATEVDGKEICVFGATTDYDSFYLQQWECDSITFDGVTVTDENQIDEIREEISDAVLEFLGGWICD